MKLFNKTFIFFISIIILQASLTIFIITNIIKKNNLEDARKELSEEATVVYENYNSWKRSIWINLITLSNDEKLKNILQNYNSFSVRRKLVPYINENMLVSGIDCLVIKSTAHPHLEIIPKDYNILTLSDLKDLKNSKPHPYIQTAFLGHVLSLVGTTRIMIQTNSSVDIFIIKQIDEEFCNHITANRRSYASFLLDNTFIIGSFEGESLLPSIDITYMESAYKEFYNREISKISYNMTIQKLGDVIIEEGSRSLFLATFLSNLPYQRRLVLIKRTVLYVSMFGAFLTAILSLFLSKNISKPVKNLLAAMYHVRNGRYNTKIKMKSKTEIGKLFQGFNEMALKLCQDKTQMENYIHEITMLKDYNEKIIHSIRAGIAIINTDFIIEKANRSFLDYFDLNEENTIEKKIHNLNIEIIDNDILQNIKSVIHHKKAYYSKIKRAKHRNVFEIKLYPLFSTHENYDEVSGCVFTVEDISKKVEFEEKIFQAEKLSSISMLSAGVAHEINNPLSSIMSNVQNLIEEEGNEDNKISLKWIEQETRRIARTVRELLNFSSSDTDNYSGSDVNEVIAKVINLIKYSIKKEENILIETAFKKHIPHAVIHEDELQQVIINLINNAIQAVEARGKVIIRTSSSRNNHTINIMVQDNGKGINEEHIPHIFDPFFTTKRNGEGTGLGLSVVYGIVKKYNGNIKVESKEGAGTKISLAVPSL